jgi:hypothetical protein
MLAYVGGGSAVRPLIYFLCIISHILQFFEQNDEVNCRTRTTTGSRVKTRVYYPVGSPFAASYLIENQ